MLANSNQKYGPVSRLLHWSSAVIIFGLIGIGLYMTGLDREDPSRRELYDLHKAFGSLVLLLSLVRVVWILYAKLPALPEGLKTWERKLAISAKHLLYLLIFVLPITGYCMSTFFGYPVSFFGQFELPVLFAKNKETAELFKELHSVSAYLLISVLALHISGALKHRFFDGGDRDVLKRML